MTLETCPGVLLLHSLPDGSSHFDLLLSTDPEPKDADSRCLIALRLAVRLQLGEARSFAAERIGDHRAHYLEYEGPIDGGAAGGRGGVRRVECYGVRWIERRADRLEFELIHDAGIARCVVDNAGIGAGGAMNVRPVGGAGR